jgi:hypothetical protein
MRLMFVLDTCVEYLCLCWILMSELETYETYVCVGYLC